jgi:hypothetical protein
MDRIEDSDLGPVGMKIDSKIIRGGDHGAIGLDHVFGANGDQVLNGYAAIVIGHVDKGILAI